MISYAKTDTGIVRRSNQDFLFASDQPVGPLPNLFIVADGMGGHKAGDFASRYVVEHMKENIENSDAVSPVMVLRKALEKTNLGLMRSPWKIRSGKEWDPPWWRPPSRTI